MITIIIADDHQVFRQGLRRLLTDDDRFRLLGEAKDGREALALIEELQPDVAVLDLAMPRPDGIEVVAQVNAGKSATRCIILTMKEEIYAIRRALAAGARGYLLKEAAFEEIAEAIVKVAGDKLYLGALQDNPELFSTEATERLTDREVEILHHVALGLTSRQIAEKLCISPRTVETHRQNIMEKLNLRTATALADYARKKGLS
jgi:DNA-binding NarL/FixJ family response regulator